MENFLTGWALTKGLDIIFDLLCMGFQRFIHKDKIEKIFDDSINELSKSDPKYTEITNNFKDMFELSKSQPNLIKSFTLERNLESLIRLFRETKFFKKFGDREYLSDHKISEIISKFLNIFEANIAKDSELTNELTLYYTKATHQICKELHENIVKPQYIIQLKLLSTQLKLAEEYCNQNKFQTAIKIYKEFLDSSDADKHENYWKVLNNMGRALFEINRWDEALIYIEKAYRLKPDNIEVANNLGILYLNLDRLNESEKILSDIIKYHPDYSNGHNSYGLLLGRKGKIQEGIKEIDKAIEQNPNDSDYYSAKAHLLSDNSNYDLAIIEIKKAINLNNRNYLYFIELGNYCLLKSHKVSPVGTWKKSIVKYEISGFIGEPLENRTIPEGIDEALKAFDKAEEIGIPVEDNFFKINKAICLIDAKEYSKAESLLLNIYNPNIIDDSLLSVSQNLIILYSLINQINKAESIFNTVITKIDKSLLSNIYKTMSTSYINNGQYAKALPLIDEVLAVEKKDVKFIINAGACLTQLNKFSEAEEYFLLAIEIDPNISGAYWNHGMCYYLQKMYGNAAQKFEKARSFDSSLQKPNLPVAISYFKAGYHKKALDELNKLLDFSPGKILIQGYLADLHDKIGNPDKCRFYLLEILKSAPKNSPNYLVAKQRFISHFHYDPIK